MREVVKVSVAWAVLGFAGQGQVSCELHAPGPNRCFSTPEAVLPNLVSEVAQAPFIRDPRNLPGTATSGNALSAP